jgi:transglutaminase/protease-like cytokinesis protein 3
MAGFTVGKMVVDAPDPGNHICNTILLDGKWYVVDVTWDDPVGYSGPITHYHFNAGKDRMYYSYNWRKIMEYHPIESLSDPDWQIDDTRGGRG